MCLAVPGKVTEFYDAGGVAMARVDFGGVSREACMAYLPEAQPGDYVLVHAGFAISRVDADEAERTLEDLRRMEELSLDDEAPPGS
jgi:hydrogenase expression/formation protein HypC